MPKKEDYEKLISSELVSVIVDVNGKIEDKSYFKKNKESAFENDVRKLLSRLGTKTIHLPESSKKNITLPDTLCLVGKDDEETNETAYFIEFKRGTKGHLSDIQKATFNLLFNNVKIRNFKCHNWSDFRKILNEIYLYSLDN